MVVVPVLIEKRDAIVLHRIYVRLAVLRSHPCDLLDLLRRNSEIVALRSVMLDDDG